MKNVLLFGFVMLLLLVAGCTQSSETSSNQVQSSAPGSSQQSSGVAVATPNTVTTKAVCGNGINETGETSANCCQDAGCPATFKCDSKFEGNQTTSFCKKIEKKDTFESGKIKQLMGDISLEINKEETSLIDFKKVKTKLAEMKDYTTTLKSQGYDTNTEEFMYTAAKDRSDVKELFLQTYANASSMNAEQAKTAIAKSLQDVTNLITTLEALKTQYSANLAEAQQIYGWDIDENIDSWKETKTGLTELKARSDKGVKADLSILEVDKECYESINSATISSVKVKIENTGGFDFEAAKLDVSIYSGGSLVDKETDSVYDTITAGQTYYEDASVFITDLHCSNYKIKVDLRNGADPTVYGTAEANIEID